MLVTKQFNLSIFPLGGKMKITIFNKIYKMKITVQKGGEPQPPWLSTLSSKRCLLYAVTNREEFPYLETSDPF